MALFISNINSPRAFAIQLISFQSFFNQFPNKNIYISTRQDQVQLGMINFTGSFSPIYAILFLTKQEAINCISNNITQEFNPTTIEKTGNVISLNSNIDGNIQFLIKEIDPKYLKINEENTYHDYY